MRRLLPYPFLTLALLGLWLLLWQSASPGALVLGFVLAAAAIWILKLLDPPRVGLRQPAVALRLAVTVVVEIVRSNNAVARIIIGPHAQSRRSGFVRIPLASKNPHVLAALACIITATPGTIWVEYESTGNTMLLHVLDLIDEAQWVTTIKQRYEAPLMEIFE